MTLQRYNPKNALSSISGYILYKNAIEKSILQNIKKIGRNREGDAFSGGFRGLCMWQMADGSFLKPIGNNYKEMVNYIYIIKILYAGFYPDLK